MLAMDQYEMIRTASRVYGQNVSKLSRVTRHSRNTIKKAIRGEPWGYKERAHQPFPALEAYIPIIDGWLEKDKSSPKKQRHTARRIHNRLVEEHGYKGSEPTVRRYVRYAKLKLGLGVPCAFIPSDPETGYEAEVDWGGAVALLDGHEAHLKFFCMRSKYSGKHFVRFYSCERQQAFFDGHIHAFAFFGGIFPVLIYDNLTAAIRRVLQGRDRIEQESYVKFKSYYSFEARFCNPDSGNEKGGVEGIVGFARRNYMVPIPEAATLEELNEKILQKCVIYGSHKISGRDRTVSELYEDEKAHLLAEPEVAFSNVQLASGSHVDKYATVIVEKNRYSVPTVYAGLKARVMLYVEQVEIFIGSKKAAVHDRVYGNNKWVLNPDHYLELIAQRPMAFNSARPIREWRKSWSPFLIALLKKFQDFQGETKGIKDFIAILMMFRDYPADEMEAAVELAVENNLSSSEGVRHILVYTKKDEAPAIPPLKSWPLTATPDVKQYGQLGGVQ